MDAAVPQLGPGDRPADSPLWGAADTISVKQLGKPGAGHYGKMPLSPALFRRHL